LRGVNCLSQCKRSCTVALSGPGRFTYVFGDLDPEAPDHADAVLAVTASYAAAPEGFLAREDRPAPLRAGILGRVPPLSSASDLIVPLVPVAAE
jgi:predicted metal-binding protein